MDKLSEWLAKAEISELITRYVALNDAGDWDAIANTYTDDGRMSRPTAPDDFIVGRDAILAAFKARPQRSARHIIANIQVSLDSPDSATATSQILLFTAAESEDGGLPVQSASPPLIGTYQDRLVRETDGWRFRERRGSLDFRKPT